MTIGEKNWKRKSDGSRYDAERIRGKEISLVLFGPKRDRSRFWGLFVGGQPVMKFKRSLTARRAISAIPIRVLVGLRPVTL